MIGWISAREFFAHLKNAAPDFDSRAAAVKILAAYFEGDTSLFPEPDEGESETAAFRIANWETIGAPTPEQKAHIANNIDDYNIKEIKFIENYYKHYKHYHQNRFGIWGRLATEGLISKDQNPLFKKFSWADTSQYIQKSNHRAEIADYFIENIEIRNSDAYRIINHFGWSIPHSWIESFCIDLKNVGKRGRKSNQPKQTPEVWLKRIIDDGWHELSQNGTPTAAAIIQNLFCPHIKLDTVRSSITRDYLKALEAAEDAQKAADLKIVMSNRSLID